LPRLRPTKKTKIKTQSPPRPQSREGEVDLTSRTTKRTHTTADAPKWTTTKLGETTGTRTGNRAALAAIPTATQTEASLEASQEGTLIATPKEASLVAALEAANQEASQEAALEATLHLTRGTAVIQELKAG